MQKNELKSPTVSAYPCLWSHKQLTGAEGTFEEPWDNVIKSVGGGFIQRSHSWGSANVTERGTTSATIVIFLQEPRSRPSRVLVRCPAGWQQSAGGVGGINTSERTWNESALQPPLTTQGCKIKATLRGPPHMKLQHCTFGGSICCIFNHPGDWILHFGNGCALNIYSRQSRKKMCFLQTHLCIDRIKENQRLSVYESAFIF